MLLVTHVIKYPSLLDPYNGHLSNIISKTIHNFSTYSTQQIICTAQLLLSFWYFQYILKLFHTFFVLVVTDTFPVIYVYYLLKKKNYISKH